MIQALPLIVSQIFTAVMLRQFKDRGLIEDMRDPIK
jgi:hypothetical protein